MKQGKFIGYVNVFGNGYGMYTGNLVHTTKKDAEQSSQQEKTWETDRLIGVSPITISTVEKTSGKQQLALWT